VKTAMSSAGEREPSCGWVSRTRDPAAAGPARGFTLLEILVVLSIASLLLTLVPLAFSGSVDLVRSKGAARELAATLQAARSRAVAGNLVVAVELNAATGRYRVGANGDERVLPDGVRLTLVEVEKPDDGSDRGRIRFFPDGSSSGARLRLNDGERRFQISVQWLLGRVDITQGDAT